MKWGGSLKQLPQLHCPIIHEREKKQEGNVLLEPAAPMFHQLIFGNVSIKNPKIHEIQKSVNSKNP